MSRCIDRLMNEWVDEDNKGSQMNRRQISAQKDSNLHRLNYTQLVRQSDNKTDDL